MPRTLVGSPENTHAASMRRLHAHLRRQADALKPLDPAALAAADRAFTG